MVQSKRSRQSKQSKRSKQSRRTQRGGNGYGFTGSAYNVVNGMAPIESRIPYSTCEAVQRGGGCGCGLRIQGGGGSDGYSTVPTHDMGGKAPMYAVNPCVQMGGNAAQQYGVISNPAGYSFLPIQTNDVPVMAVVPYGGKGGGKRTKKNRKTHRRTHRKTHRRT